MPTPKVSKCLMDEFFREKKWDGQCDAFLCWRFIYRWPIQSAEDFEAKFGLFEKWYFI
jgi:hypothetical protein